MHRKRKQILYQIFFILVMTCIYALLFRMIAQSNYNDADAALSEGNYNEAQELFSKYSMFSDSDKKSNQIAWYLQAIELYDNGELGEALDLFISLRDFEKSTDYVDKIKKELEEDRKSQQYNEACRYMLQKDYPKAVQLFEDLEDYEDSESLAFQCEDAWRLSLASTLSAGTRSSAGIKPDNTVEFTPADGSFLGAADILNWDHIVSVSVGGEIATGLRDDGTVVTAKAQPDESYDSQIDTDSWSNIVAVSTGNQYVVGLKRDGTVVASSLLQPDGYGETSVTDWSGIVAIDTAWHLTAGLDQDGNVHLAGYHAEELQKEIEAAKTDPDPLKRWTDIVAISVGGSCGTPYRGGAHVVGLTKDGRVVAVGDNNFYQCEVSNWNEEKIIAISAGDYHTVALTEDGCVLTTQSKDCHFDNVDFSESVNAIMKWDKIVEVSAGYGYTLGLKADGTVVAAGNKNDGQANVRGWNIALPVTGYQQWN